MAFLFFFFISFWEISILISKMTVLVCTPISREWGLLFPYIFSNICCQISTFKNNLNQIWPCGSLVPAHRRQKQVSLYLFQANLVNIVNFRTIESLSQKYKQFVLLMFMVFCIYIFCTYMFAPCACPVPGVLGGKKRDWHIHRTGPINICELSCGF